MINFGSHHKLMFKTNIPSYSRAHLKYNAKSHEPFRFRNVKKGIPSEYKGNLVDVNKFWIIKDDAIL